jgi:hypothetical protein
MSNNFQVEFKKSNGNLHVHPSGDLDGSSAWDEHAGCRCFF